MKDVSIFGNTFKNVKGFKLPDPQGQEVKFVQTDGTLTVTDAGTYDVSGYESVVVDIESGYISQRDVANTTGVTKVISASESSGGSSDFSTAEVTFVLNRTGSGIGGVNLKNMPFVFDDQVLFTNPGASGTYIVPLYKGNAICEPTEFGDATITNVSVVGNAEQDGGDILIMGDCTITIDITLS